MRTKSDTGFVPLYLSLKWSSEWLNARKCFRGSPVASFFQDKVSQMHLILALLLDWIWDKLEIPSRHLSFCLNVNNLPFLKITLISSETVTYLYLLFLTILKAFGVFSLYF